MRWEHMIPSKFNEYVHQHQVCIIPVGSLERHGEHIPLGCDMLIAHTVACLAAEKEPAVVFPPYFLMQVHEASCFSGTVNFPQAFAVEALGHLVDSIAQNGFKKIFIVNGHGGNIDMLNYFTMSRLDCPREYELYHAFYYNCINGEERKRIKSVLPQSSTGHAGSDETSLFMACCPGTVDMSRVPAEPIVPQGKLAHLKDAGIYSPLWWYADYPENVTGDASKADAEAGKVLLETYSNAVARAIKVIKGDTMTTEVRREFLTRLAGKGNR